MKWLTVPMPAGGVAVALLVVAACSDEATRATADASPPSDRPQATGQPSRDSAVDGPTYDTVAALAAESDLVARATPTQIVDKGEDCGGGNPSIEGQCLPYVVWTVAVDEVLAGEAPAQIAVVWPDAERFSTVANASLAAGIPLVLFLNRIDPSVPTFGGHYVPFHSDQGVFDVAGDKATARSETVRGLTSPETGSGRLTVPLADLESTAAAASAAD